MPTGNTGFYTDGFDGIVVDDAELLRKLKELERAAGDRPLRNALTAGARVIRDAAKTHVVERTGELKGTIRIRTRSLGRQAMEARIVAGNSRGKGWYAHFVEFGTDPHIVRKSKKGLGRLRHRVHPGAAPQPFLRPAFDEKKDEALRRIHASLNRQFSKIAKG
ncbi:MAG: hypothetical protein GY906_11630 [bacterium]|nr:hypothetical protein [bacterium]